MWCKNGKIGGVMILRIRFQCEKCKFAFDPDIMHFFEKLKCPECGNRELLMRYIFDNENKETP